MVIPELALDETRPSDIERAFERSLPEMQALQKERLLAVNLDVRSAACTGLGAVKRLGPWRARLVSELPILDMVCLDRLEQYTHAMMYAEVQYTLARKRPADIEALTVQTRQMYEVLRADAHALAKHGLIQPECLAKMAGRRSNVAKAFGLSGVVHVLRTSWPSIEGKTAITLDDLDMADAQAMRLILALAHRKQPMQDFAKIAEYRQRAFTLFSNAYTELRRAIQYLCADAREAERIIPTLYPRKRRERKSKPSVPIDSPPTATPSTQTAEAAPMEVSSTVEPLAQAPMVLAQNVPTRRGSPRRKSKRRFGRKHIKHAFAFGKV